MKVVARTVSRSWTTVDPLNNNFRGNLQTADYLWPARACPLFVTRHRAPSPAARVCEAQNLPTSPSPPSRLHVAPYCRRKHICITRLHALTPLPARPAKQLSFAEANRPATRKLAGGPAADDATSHLDSFLRLETNASDIDLDISKRKDKKTSLKDIHLEDSREWPDTLYKQIYGIPETWLSLLSQTTRLANVMEAFRQGRHKTPSQSSASFSFKAWDTLQRRSVRLEYMICSLNARHQQQQQQPDRPQPGFASTNTNDNSSNDNIDTATTATTITNTQPPDPTRTHMHNALTTALLIFFYRRIRNLHPLILQHYVDGVMTSLEAFQLSLPQPTPAIGLGCIWPAFIAGCEAMDSERQESVLRWLDIAFGRCNFGAVQIARDVMQTVWRRRADEMGSISSGTVEDGPRRRDRYRNIGKEENVASWVNVVKEEGTWPMFC